LFLQLLFDLQFGNQPLAFITLAALLVDPYAPRIAPNAPEASRQMPEPAHIVIADDPAQRVPQRADKSDAINHRQLEVFSLPPYSPDFNATERLWHYTRKASNHNRYFDRPAALCQALFATFTDMQQHPEKIQGL
jgi:hypothetical protein